MLLVWRYRWNDRVMVIYGLAFYSGIWLEGLRKTRRVGNDGQYSVLPFKGLDRICSSYGHVSYGKINFFLQIWVIGTTFTVNWSTCSQSILEQGMQTQQNLNGLWTNIATHLLHIWVISIYWTSLPLVRMKQKQEWDLIWWRRCCSHVALHQRNQRTRIQLCENYYNPLSSFFCPNMKYSSLSQKWMNFFLTKHPVTTLTMLEIFLSF